MCRVMLKMMGFIGIRVYMRKIIIIIIMGISKNKMPIGMGIMFFEMLVCSIRKCLATTLQ
jgi:hypothetical protein